MRQAIDRLVLRASLLALLSCALGASTAFANPAQRLVVDAGVNLGLWQVQLQLFDTPATDPTQVAYATFTVDAVSQLIPLLQPPFEDLDLQAVLDRIARYPQATAGMPAAHRAAYVDQTYGLLRSRLSVRYLSTHGIYAGANCDSSFLDVGYHLGRAQMAAFAGDSDLVQSARSALLQSIRVGLDLADGIGCGFHVADAWHGVRADLARTFEEYRALVAPVRTIAFEARQPAFSVGPVPSTPFQRGTDAVADRNGVWVRTATIASCGDPSGAPLVGGDGYHAWSLSGTRMTHAFRYPHPPTPTDAEQRFDVQPPPDTLVPGEAIDLRIVATGGGSNPTISGETLEVHAGLATVAPTGIDDFTASADLLARVGIGFHHGTGPREATARVVAPTAGDGSYTIGASLASARAEARWGCSVRWVYEFR